MQFAKARGWTGAVVYFDAIAAFAAMLRALVCHQSSRGHPTSDALKASAFSAEEAATMSREALHATVTAPSPAPVRMLCPTHGRLHRECRKWQQREGAPRRTNLWLILLLECSCARILQRARDRMDDQGLVARLPEMEAVHDISHVDDASAYTWGPDAQTVITNVKAIVAIYHEEFLRHGLQLNYAAGKSECLVALREQVFVADKAILTVEYEAGSLSLRVADAYKHQGGSVASSGSQCRELQALVKAMNSGVAALNHPEMSKHEVPLEDKLQLCATLADARLFLYAGTWTSMGVAQQQALHGPRMHTLRRATNMYRRRENENEKDRDVLVATGCYTIDVQVAMLRLLLFARLVQW